MSAAPCIICDQARASDAHSRHEIEAGRGHDYAKPEKVKAQRPLIPRMSTHRAEYLVSSPRVEWRGQPCAVRSPVCTMMGEGTHHVAARGRFGGLEAAERSGPVVVACNRCNTYIGDHPAWAMVAGWLLSPKGRLTP